MDYDVFISCKSEDYEYAEEVYDFLKSNGIYTFLASKELRKMGESEYMEAISEALDSACHLIVLTSAKQNVESKWVKFEWSTFLNEILSERKKGQIMTILKDLDVHELPIVLRKYESFTTDNYRERIISYVETPASQKRKEDAKRREQEEKDRQRKEREQELRKEKIRKEIEEKEADYLRHSKTLDEIALDIIRKHKEIGETEKVCPICEERTPIESPYCKRCGWTFQPSFSLNSVASEEQTFLARSNWKALCEGQSKKETEPEDAVIQPDLVKTGEPVQETENKAEQNSVDNGESDNKYIEILSVESNGVDTITIRLHINGLDNVHEKRISAFIGKNFVYSVFDPKAKIYILRIKDTDIPHLPVDGKNYKFESVVRLYIRPYNKGKILDSVKIKLSIDRLLNFFSRNKLDIRNYSIV